MTADHTAENDAPVMCDCHNPPQRLAAHDDVPDTAEKCGVCGATRDEPEKCGYPGGCPIPPGSTDERGQA